MVMKTILYEYENNITELDRHAVIELLVLQFYCHSGMRRFSAQFIFTNSGPPAKRAVICTEDDGTIISIVENEGSLQESQSVEFYNGIIVPGFVNCHCHLELSHMKGAIPEGTGLGNFIMQIRNSREINPDNDLSMAHTSDKLMYR